MSEPVLIEHFDTQCQVSGVLDFTTAREALERIGALVKTNAQLHVSFEKVGRCNSAALALMIELRAIARRSGNEVTFGDVPDGLTQLAKVCQVDQFIA